MKKIQLTALCILLVSRLGAQGIDMVRVEAREEFRWGVSAYHSGFFDKAVLSLERSISLDPESMLTRFWLGEAYRRLGFEETALRIWDDIVAAGQADSLLVNRMDLLDFRRGVGPELSVDINYLPSHSIQGRVEDFRIFERPSTVAVLNDGSYLLTSFATNQVLLIDANGAVRDRFQGGLAGFDHPFGVAISPDQKVLVSEFQRDTIVQMSLRGGEIRRFGASGNGAGQLSGPQFISFDADSSFYVSEAGNRRVSKFDSDGNFLFHFGARSGNFPGFLSPSGIVVLHSKVYVGDSRSGVIHVFDSSGNFLETVGNGLLEGPEGLTALAEDRILIADNRRLVLYEPAGSGFSVLHEFKDREARITDAALDANFNVMAVDFNLNRVQFMARAQDIYAGLVVDIVSVYADRFPAVQLTLDVSDRSGRPFHGLRASNIILTEAGRGIDDFRLIADTRPTDSSAYGIVVEQSPTSRQAAQDFLAAFEQIQTVMGSGHHAALVTAGSDPVLHTGSGVQSRTLADALASNTAGTWDLGKSLFMAASDMVTQRTNRGVFLVTSGTVPDQAFNNHSLVQLGNYLRTNRIPLYVIYTADISTRPDELEYLVRVSGGDSGYIYQGIGVQPMVESFRSKPSGLYILEYQSSSETAFGERYLPLDVEVSIFTRTGRDRKGYFAPLH